MYAGPAVASYARLYAIRPHGARVDFPVINVNGISPQAGRFVPDGKGFIYRVNQNFWRLNLSTMESRQLTDLSPAEVGSFDISSDGRIVFDRFKRKFGYLPH